MATQLSPVVSPNPAHDTNAAIPGDLVSNAATITEYLAREAGRIGPDIYRRLCERSPWIRLMPRGQWPDGMGVEISNITFERALPTSLPAWTPLAAGGDATGDCGPAAVDVEVGHTLRQWGLARRVLHGPPFCVEDIRYNLQLSEQLNNIMDILEDRALFEWEDRYRLEYPRLCEFRVNALATGFLTLGVNTGLALPYAQNPASYHSFDVDVADKPDSGLGQGMLDQIKMRLMRDGAGRGALGRENGMPIFTLITSYEASDNIIQQDSIRADLHWGQPNELLRPFGVERSYKGFYHIIDPYPLRYDYDTDHYVNVPPFLESAAPVGKKTDLNPAYLIAEFELSQIFQTTVMESMVPSPITAPARNFRFDPQNYMGEWKLMNILHKEDNPDGTIIFHRGIFTDASKPRIPQHGYAILHKRIDPINNATVPA